MKRVIGLILSCMIFSSSQAYAGCWTQCLGLSIGGTCYGPKQKVCNWSGWQKDIDHVGKELSRFTKDVDREWKGLYRRNLPKNVRQVINSSTILFAGAYALGVVPEAIGGTLLYIVGRTVSRADKGKAVHDDDKPWVKKLEEQGNAMIMAVETEIALSHGEAQSVFLEKIDNERVYDKYLSCLVDSTSKTQALKDCYLELGNTLHTIKNEAIVEVLDSEI